MRKNRAKANKVDIALMNAQTALGLTFDEDLYTPELGNQANDIFAAIENFRSKLATVMKRG